MFLYVYQSRGEIPCFFIANSWPNEEKHSMEEKKMSETVNQGNNNATGNDTKPKLFTQAEVDAIVSDRLKRAGEKYKDYDDLKAKADKFDELEAEGKTELEKATKKAADLQAKLEKIEKEQAAAAIRAKVAKENNISADLLTGDTEEDCKAQAKAMLEYFKPDGYPDVKDGGEPATHGAGGKTRDQFAEFFEQAMT